MPGPSSNVGWSSVTNDHSRGRRVTDRLSLLGDRLVPNYPGHVADDGRIWVVPPSSTSPAAAQNLGVLRATRPVDHAVPDDFRSLRVPADVHLVLVPEPNGRPHIQPALESTHKRQRRTVERVALTGLAQCVPNEFFIGLLVRRIRVPMELFPCPRVRQLLVFGITRVARQLFHVGRIENRPGHREPRLGRQPPTAKAETGLDLIRAPRVRVDLEGQRVERLGGHRHMFGGGQFEQPRRIAGTDRGAGCEHELGQLRLLADARGRRQVPRIQPGAGQVDGRCRLRGQYLSRITHGAPSAGHPARASQPRATTSAWRRMDRIPEALAQTRRPSKGTRR